MTVKTFFYGLIASFGLPWLLLVAVPFAKMRSLEPAKFTETEDGVEALYHQKRNGRIGNGANIYAAEGCAACHSQLARPTYAGNDLFRPDLAGLAKDADRGDTRRESNPWDYIGEKYAQIGETRTGPDLGNVGRRYEAAVAAANEATAKELGIQVNELEEKQTVEELLYAHLFDPRQRKGFEWSVCPSNKHFFKKVSAAGQGSPEALSAELVGADSKTQVVPNEKAKALVSYLANLKRDDAVPYSMNYDRKKKKANEK